MTAPLSIRARAGGDEVTIRAATILTAQRIARQLTVNALAVSVLTDKRAAAPLTAAQLEPNARPRDQGKGVTTADYVATYFKLSETITRGVEARVEGDWTRAARLHQQADRLADEMDDLQDALRRSTSRVRVGHLTAYTVSVPPVAYVHPDPQIGIHARQDAQVVTVDTVTLDGADLAVFLEFQRTFPARGNWPLYAPDKRDGVQATKHHVGAEEARRIFGQLIAQHPGSIPRVYAVAPDESLT